MEMEWDRRESWSGKPFNYYIPFEVAGKAGETKTVSASASTDGKLLLFRAMYLDDATDTSSEPGMGTLIQRVRIGSEVQRILPDVTRLFHPSRMSRSAFFALLHPRLEASFDVFFKEDCVWTAKLYGSAAEVKDEGIFASKPPEEPCGSSIPAEFSDESHYAEAPSRGNVKCKHCWHPFRNHGRWPWRTREYSIGIEVVEPGGTGRIVLEVERSFDPQDMVGQGFRTAAHPFAKGSSDFRTGGFAVAGRRQSVTIREPFKFAFNFHSWMKNADGGGGKIWLPKGGALEIDVGNATDVRRSFKATVRGIEHVVA